MFHPSSAIHESNGKLKGNFSETANATLGRWKANIDYQPISWNPGNRVNASISLSLSSQLLDSLVEKYPNIDKICILITAERDFDSMGLQHIPCDYGASTLLTPSGLPIEGGGMMAQSRFTGSTYRTPVDILLEIPLAEFNDRDAASEWHNAAIPISFDLPKKLPPGIYRLRFDLGFKTEQSKYWDWVPHVEQYLYNFNEYGIGSDLPWDSNRSCIFSPPIEASGTDFTGKWINGSEIRRRAYWVLLWGYNSNGYQGVIAKEDQNKTAISPRNIIHDEVVLPRFDSNGYPMEYNLEPCFLLDNIYSQREIPYRYDSGEWSVKITLPNGTAIDLWPNVKLPIPNGTKIDLGTSRFLTRSKYGATTNNTSLTSWVPPAYGRYEVEASGWIEDIWGNRYDGGGHYSFWIANRLTIATATFQGQSYKVGSRYGRDLAFFPSVPADVTIKADLYENSESDNVRTVVSAGKATQEGIFGAAQGMRYLPLDSPGEYQARITATYWDHEGNLWVGVMRHAGIVYPDITPIEAHGKKLYIQDKYVDRGETHFEGHVSENGTYYDHINFPYNSGDALLIASDQQSTNKIVPVLTYEANDDNTSCDPVMPGTGRSNLQIKTRNGLSPDMFPEYITDMAYFYASAPRPGFISRFIVAQDNVLAPYWQVSPNNFGEQYGASYNGDLPGDIYRLLGGVVSRPSGQNPLYAGYQASAFILPKGSNNNRIVGPGDEDLPSPDGEPARFFLVPVRPGSVYMKDANFSAVLQIDPIVECNIQFTLTAPDGSVRVTKGKGDQYGYFISKEIWPLDQPGVWTYTVNATWNGHHGKIPGLPDSGGYIFVLENESRVGTGMTLNMPGKQIFSPTGSLEIQGNSSASKVYFTAITPGAVLDEGIIPVSNDKFIYMFDPKKMAQKISTYDIMNLESGEPEIGRIVHLTFFSEENGVNGPYHSFARVILRGTEAIYLKN